MALPFLRNEDICPRPRQDADLSEDGNAYRDDTEKGTYFIPVKPAIWPLRRQLVLARARAQPWTGETDGWIAGQVVVVVVQMVSAWHGADQQVMLAKAAHHNSLPDEEGRRSNTEAQTADALLCLSKWPCKIKIHAPE